MQLNDTQKMMKIKKNTARRTIFYVRVSAIKPIEIWIHYLNCLCVCVHVYVLLWIVRLCESNCQMENDPSIFGITCSMSLRSMATQSVQTSTAFLKNRHSEFLLTPIGSIFVFVYLADSIKLVITFSFGWHNSKWYDDADKNAFTLGRNKTKRNAGSNGMQRLCFQFKLLQHQLE